MEEKKRPQHAADALWGLPGPAGGSEQVQFAAILVKTKAEKRGWFCFHDPNVPLLGRNLRKTDYTLHLHWKD